MTTIAIVIFDGVEELDFVGPWEVLAAWASQAPQDEVEVYTVAWTPAPVRCAKRLAVLADRTRDEFGSPDVVIIPGGRGTRPLMQDTALLQTLQDAHKRGALVTSVCTGSLLLAAAGLLDDSPATTHWSALDRLAAAGHNIEVRANDRFVDNGSVITSAGVSAGIDMALHLVSRLQSPERAIEVRRYIQYDPAPPI